jgi:hypothetical protein
MTTTTTQSTYTREVVRSMDRTAVCAAIKRHLKARTGITFSVTGGRGTAWGWLYIAATKQRAADQWGRLTPSDAKVLADALGLRDEYVGDSVSIPAGSDWWTEYLQRAETGACTVRGERRWD